jgi:hypothetical protein
MIGRATLETPFRLDASFRDDVVAVIASTPHARLSAPPPTGPPRVLSV